MLFKFPITIQTRNEDDEKWVEHITIVRARINKNTKSRGYENLGAGAIQIKRSLMFEVRYSPKISEIAHNTQLFRIVYEGNTYNIIDYDDFQEKHQTVILTGAYYG